jgi:Tfp pilus assembly protein FimT
MKIWHPGSARASHWGMRFSLQCHAGTTLAELAAVLALTAIVLSVAIPQSRRVVERAAVRGAVADVVTTLSAARQIAVARGGGVAVTVDERAATLRVVRGADTLETRPLGRAFGVTLRSTRDSLAYDARGLGSGAANLTLVVVRGATADTVVVSRLGRVRW